MSYLMKNRRPAGVRPASLVLRISTFVLWSGAALIVTLLLMRFGMRALGVRPDIALPGIIYALTASVVQPFYRFFPLPTPYGERFDIAVVETASLAAAGAVLIVALALYMVGLLLARDKPIS